MKNIFYKFEWDATNFKSESRRFGRFLGMAKQTSTGIISLKTLPPCIFQNDSFVKIVESPVYVHENSVLITNNFFFGGKFLKINSRFSKSPFISDICQKCSFYKRSLCRGLMNRGFVDEKNAVIKRIGVDTYNAVKGDYENGAFMVGSECSKKCHFCFDRYIPNKILRVVPRLTPKEVFHFLHYIPKPIYNLCDPYHCRMGELSENPYLDEILSLANEFSDKLYWVTNGQNIDEKFLLKLKEKIIVSVTSITLSNRWKKYFVETDKSFDLIGFINMLRKNRINYSVGLIPFKSLIDSGDIFQTIDHLFKNDSNCIIRMQMPSSCQFFTPRMKREFVIDFKKFKSEVVKKYHQKIVKFIDDYLEDEFGVFLERNRLEEKLTLLRAQMKKICSENGTYLILCPERTYNFFKILATGRVKVACISSSLGYTNPCAGVLRVEDYMKAIKKEIAVYDNIILPQNSFDVNYDDFSLINVNNLWAGARKKTKALIFI